MSRGISWEQLHDQISELLPLLDPTVALVAGHALAQGQEVRSANRGAAHQLDETLDQVGALLPTLNPAKPESYLLSAVQHLLMGLSPMGVLTTHLIAAWPKVQAARRALAARPVPPSAGSLRGPGDGPRPEDTGPTWPHNNRHEAGALAMAATRQM